MNWSHTRNMRVFHSGLIVVAATGIVHALQYVFAFLLGRILAPDAYGVVITVFSLITTVGIAFKGVQLSASHAFARSQNTPSFRTLLTQGSRYVTYTLLLSLITTPVIASFLHISPLLIFLAGISLAAGLARIMTTGALQGLRLFTLFSTSNILDVGIRILLVITATLALTSATTVIASFTLASVISLGATLYMARRALRNYTSDTTQPLQAGLSAPRIMIWVSVVVTSSYYLDIFFAQRYLSQHEAGIYAAAHVLARIISYALLSASPILLPHLTTLQNTQPHQAKKHVLLWIAVAFGAGSLLTILLSVWGLPLVTTIFGSAYHEAATLIPLLSVAATAWAITDMGSYYFLTTRPRTFAHISTILLIFYAASLFSFHSSGMLIAYIATVAQCCIALTTIALLIFHTPPHAKPHHPA